MKPSPHILIRGGNTLNQRAIWRAQGIDRLLRRAWKRGVVLGGASAGERAWRLSVRGARLQEPALPLTRRPSAADLR